MQPGRTLSVEARVNRSGVSTFVNRHAWVPAPKPAAPPAELSVDDRLTSALASGQQLGAVPVQAATLLRRAPGGRGGMELTISLQLPPAASGPAKGPITAMFGLAAEGAAAGAALTSGRRVIDAAGPDGAYSTTFGVPVTSGAYHLRVAVADAEGAIGAIATDLDATLPTLGPFTASDLLVAWVDDQGRPQLMALDPLPARATSVRAELELYPPATGVALDTVQVEIVLTQVGAPDPIDERFVTPRDADGVWRVAAEFASADLSPGRYTLRARVHIGDDVVGTTLASFVK
jgi:hypothetical protein